MPEEKSTTFTALVAKSIWCARISPSAETIDVLSAHSILRLGLFEFR